MQIIKVGDKSCIKKALAALSAGGVILFPTDTLYGFGADALSDEAVEKIYKIKGRDERKPMHAVASDIAMMEEYAGVPDMARMLAKEFMPGALTLILRKRDGINTGIAHGIPTIGFRIPNNPFCLKLAKEFGRPFTATSANRSGEKPECNARTILEQLGEGRNKIDLFIDAGELPECQPSTVVDCSGKEPIILREGAIPASDIWNAIRGES